VVKKKNGRPAPPAATSSGIPILPFYGDPAPGEFPFTRGISREAYRQRYWTMRQYAGFGSARDSNRRYRYLLGQGQTGLSVAFDLPTQMGYDSDDPLARGEVGKVGVAIATIEDMRILTEGLPLESVSVSMTINSTAAILLALWLAVARERGVSWDKLTGTVQNDLLKEYVARGTYIFPPRPSLKLTTDIFEFCGREVPRWNTISISGYHIREAGSTAVQEVAFTLSNAIAYVEAALARRLSIDDFAPRISFFFNAHSNFFEEIAKFRAARRLWAEIARDRFGAKDPRSWRLRFHTQTAGSTLTAQQTDVNAVRVALQALSAVLGGTQSLHTNAADEALALPTESSARLALRTQQVIACETGVADVGDPGPRPHADRKNRLSRRRRRRDRRRLLRPRDRGGLLRGAAGAGRGAAIGRRRQRLPGGIRCRSASSQRGPGDRTGTGRALARFSRRPRLRPGEDLARTAQRRRPRGQKPRPSDPRCRPVFRHPGGDHHRAKNGLGRVPSRRLKRLRRILFRASENR
jgi:methylmalonyl-CoA mutase cobalamin-binding domain/chain